MATDSGVYARSASPFVLFTQTLHAGVATRKITFTAPVRCEVVELQSSALAADSTDKFTASLEHVTVAETLITGSVVNAAQTPVRVTTMDSGKSAILEAGHIYTVTLTFAGTAANVTGPYVALWVKAANHNIS